MTRPQVTTEDVQRRVIEALRRRTLRKRLTPVRTAALVKWLQRNHIQRQIARRAIWELLDDRAVDLTADLRLSLAKGDAGAATRVAEHVGAP